MLKKAANLKETSLYLCGFITLRLLELSCFSFSWTSKFNKDACLFFNVLQSTRHLLAKAQFRGGFYSRLQPESLAELAPLLNCFPLVINESLKLFIGASFLPELFINCLLQGCWSLFWIEAFLPLIIQDTSETVISWIQKALRRNSKLIEMRCSLFIKALVFSCPALYLGQLLSRLFKMMNSFAHLQGFALDLINWPLEGTGLNLLGKYKGTSNILTASLEIIRIFSKQPVSATLTIAGKIDFLLKVLLSTPFVALMKACKKEIMQYTSGTFSIEEEPWKSMYAQHQTNITSLQRLRDVNEPFTEIYTRFFPFILSTTFFAGPDSLSRHFFHVAAQLTLQAGNAAPLDTLVMPCVLNMSFKETMELIGDPKFNTRYLAACIEAVMHMPSITHEHFLDLQKLFIGFIDQLVDTQVPHLVNSLGKFLYSKTFYEVYYRSEKFQSHFNSEDWYFAVRKLANKSLPSLKTSKPIIYEWETLKITFYILIRSLFICFSV
ncbi:uncharacterized protein LOC135121869 [Zophobas morio]|uniref:uncharacterized protein LOC135121869 n=1 Tax=Zophobas morio TaxID=2755281 RepID=UPI003082D716